MTGEWHVLVGMAFCWECGHVRLQRLRLHLVQSLARVLDQAACSSKRLLAVEHEWLAVRTN